MQREIKFRVWHKELQKFLPQEEWLIDFNGRLRFIDKSDGLLSVTKGSLTPIANENLYVVQQFTGLKDKNGKEIYEGDILKLKRPTQILKAVFEDGCFFLNDESGIFVYEVNKSSEIIGNIFENPELLNA